jgi:hypothetical protein
MNRLEDRTLPSVTLGVHVTAITQGNSSCGCEPPDPIFAAGPNNGVEMVNSAMQILTKSGSVVSTTPLATLFSSLSPVNLSDPFVLFDVNIANSSGPNGRFIVGVLDYISGNAPDNLDFAVSDSADATGGFSAVHQFAVGEGSFFADYPRVGFNADAFLVTFNMFGASSGFYDHPQIMAIQLSSVTSGSSSTFTSFSHDQSNSLFTIVPAIMHGATAGGPEYFVTEGASAGRVDVIKETNVLSGTPTETDNNINVAGYAQPPAAPQPSGTMTANDSRMLQAAWRGNMLVATQTVGTGSPQEAHARWYQFDTSGAPTLTQSGEINPGSGIATYFPSIDIDSNNDIGMTYMESSHSEFVSMYVTGRTPSDPAGTMETGVKALAGTANYNGTRAGDFSGTSVDPSNGTTFWSGNEFITSNFNANWSTGVASFAVASVDHLSISAPSSATAGTAFTITVSALTASNAADPNYRGTIHFTSSDTAAVLPADYLFTPADAGVHTFTNMVTLKTAGSKTITAADTAPSGGATSGSATVTVSPGAANKLVFGQQPTNVLTNAVITPSPTVRILDAFGNLETGDSTDMVTMAIGTNPAGGTLGGTTTITAAGGVATFSTLTINTAGNGYTLAASSGSLTGTTSNAFNVTTPVATHFSVTGPSATAGAAFTITVTALDANNNTAAGYGGTVHFTSSDSQAGLPADYMFTPTDGGVHTFTTGVTLYTAGSKTVTATDTVTASITGSLTVTVTPAVANKLAFGQQPTNVVAGASITPVVTVKVLDAFGNLETGDNSDSVSMAIGTNPAGGTLSGTNPVTVSGGVASFGNLSINNVGNGYTLAASSGSLTSATSNPFNVISAPVGTQPLVTYQANQVIGGNTAVGSSGFKNVPGLSITLTTGADNVRISGSLGAYNKNTGAYNFLYVRILVDGVVQGGPYGFTLTKATANVYLETFNFENDIALAAGSHTIVVQATSSSSSNVVWDPGTNQTLRVTDYHTFKSGGSDVSIKQVNANEGLPPTFGGHGTAVNNGSFATVPGLSTSFTTSSTDTVRLATTLSVDNNTLSLLNLQVRFVVDGVATAPQTFWVTPDAGPDTFRTFEFECDFANLAAGTHTISVQAETTSGANGLWYDGGTRSVPGGGGTANFWQTLRITDYKTIAGSTPAGSSGWVTIADPGGNASGALASTYTNVPGLAATFTVNATDTVRLQATLDVFNSSTTAYGFPAARFLIDGMTATTGNSWNVNFVDSTGLVVEEELVFEDFITLAAGPHTVTVQALSTAGNVSFEGSTGSNQLLRVAAFQLVSGVTVAQPALAQALASDIQAQQAGLGAGAFGPEDDMSTPSALFDGNGTQLDSHSAPTVAATSDGSAPGQFGQDKLNQHYVSAVYLDLLQRAADTDGLAFWSGQLDQGETRDSFVAQLTHSDEYFATAVVKPAYRNFLNREADLDGLAYWVNRLQHGLTDEQLEAGLTSSPEFYNQAGGTDQLWVNALYLQELGRPADAAGASFWLGQLQHRASRNHVASAFAVSPERVNQHITIAYETYLKREPDSGGLAFWLDQLLRHQKTNEDLISGLIVSDEFFQQAIL